MPSIVYGGEGRDKGNVGQVNAREALIGEQNVSEVVWHITSRTVNKTVNLLVNVRLHLVCGKRSSPIEHRRIMIMRTGVTPA